MKIAIGRMYYNEREAIEKTHPNVDATVLYFDGRFPSFDRIGDSDYSTDGSNELIATFQNAELHRCADYITKKMSAMFHEAGRFDAMLLLSCDERIEGDWNAFVRNAERAIAERPSDRLFNVPFVVHDKAVAFKSKPRLFIRPGTITVGEKHWHYWSEGRRLNQHAILGENLNPPVQGITIHHDTNIRPKWRDDLMTKYQRAAPQSIRDSPGYPYPTKNKRLLRKMGLIT